MRKFLIVLSLLPFLALCDDMSGDVYVVPKVFYYASTDTIINSPSKSVTLSYAHTNDFTNIQLFLANQYHAVSYSLQNAVSIVNQNQVNSSTTGSFKYPILQLSSGRYFDYHNFPLLEFLDSTAIQLVVSGFSIPHENAYNFNLNSPYDIVFTNSSQNVAVNIRSLIVLSTALSSSNLVYRSFVQSSLGSLSADLRSLLQSATASSSDVSALRSALDSFSANYSAVHYADLLSGSFNGHANFVLNNPLLSELGSADPNSDLFGYLSFFDSSSPADTSVRSMFNAASVPLLSDAIRAFAIDSSKSFSEYLGNPAAAQSVISSHYSTPLTNALKKMTTDWKDATTNQLAQNTANITNQLAQWKRDLKGHNDTVTNDLSKIGNSLGDVSGNVKSVADMLSGTSPAKAHVIVDNAVDVNVLNWPSEFHININANDLEAIISGSSLAAKDILDGVTNRLDDITNSVVSLAPFFAAITNLQLLVNSSITNLDFSVSNIVFDSFHALLLDDYADYITNRYYSSAIDTFKDDYPSVYTNLLKFGLSSRSGEGNFWSLFSSTLFYQSALVCGMLEDLATVRRFAEDHIEGGFQGGVTSLINKMPSSTDLADRVNQASNEVLKIEAAANSFYSAYSSMTNSGVSAFSPFRGVFSSVPENVVFFKTGNEQYVTIPVSRGGNAWSVIRLCFSFSLVAVNVIFFPKFVLMVIVLLSKLHHRFVKFVPTDAM